MSEEAKQEKIELYLWTLLSHHGGKFITNKEWHSYHSIFFIFQAPPRPPPLAWPLQMMKISSSNIDTNLDQSFSYLSGLELRFLLFKEFILSLMNCARSPSWSYCWDERRTQCEASDQNCRRWVPSHRPFPGKAHQANDHSTSPPWSWTQFCLVSSMECLLNEYWLWPSSNPRSASRKRAYRTSS